MLQMANLALSFLLELCALASFGYWGYRAGDTTLLKVILGLGAPILMITIWAGWLAPRSPRRLHSPALPITKLIVFGTAALALFRAGQPTLAIIFAIIVIINAILVEVWKQDTQATS